MPPSIEKIREQARCIAESGVLGRSRSYKRLLEFLVECAVAGRTPKELEIAAEVFGKGADFDPSQDSMVRVYAHHLRQKIHQYYSDAGRDEPEQLALPKGEYRLTLAPPDAQAAAPAVPETPRSRSFWRAAAAIVLFVVGLAVGLVIDFDRAGPARGYELAAQAPLWREVLNDDLPVLLVVGDYYIFGEIDDSGNVGRLVREYAINSSSDLDDYLLYHSEQRGRYIDLDLTYLARSTAFALRDVLRVLYTTDKPVRVVSMSELNVADIKDNHVVYVGYISAMDKLADLAFASSGLSVGATYDELINNDTGDVYWSEAGRPSNARNYRDYGLVSTFPGPGRNQFVIVAGTFDAGLMHSAQAVTDPAALRAAEQVIPGVRATSSPAFELLYEVTGYDRTNLDAMLVYHGTLDYRAIWGGEPLVTMP